MVEGDRSSCADCGLVPSERQEGFGVSLASVEPQLLEAGHLRPGPPLFVALGVGVALPHGMGGIQGCQRGVGLGVIEAGQTIVKGRLEPVGVQGAGATTRR
jgi:hypothetical protein